MLTIGLSGGGGPPSPRPRSTTRARRGIARVLAYINLNYADPICLAHLAALAAVHPSHLSREFKRQIGRTPLEYVLKLRIQRAASLLIESEKSIKEIGLSVGYKRPEAFSKAFKRVQGCSPRHFRDAGNNKGRNNAPKGQF